MLKSEGLQIIANTISNCVLCKEISENRIQTNCLTVPGEGNPNARVMVIGEAPGKDESEQGRPFVGKSGKLLTNILQAAGLPRESIFIANILKCRPPNNRDPKPEEATNCRKYLDMQIKCVDPEWIICFGKISSVHLLGCDPETSIGSLRRKVHSYNGKKVIATYHPAFCLRNPAAKQDVWEDLQPIISELNSKDT